MSRLGMSVLCVVLSFALQSGAETLVLRENDPQNMTNFTVRVSVRDQFTTLVPFSEFVFLADGGSGSLEYQQVGIIEARYIMTEFGFAYAGGDQFDSQVTTLGGKLPISLSIDAASPDPRIISLVRV